MRCRVNAFICNHQTSRRQRKFLKSPNYTQQMKRTFTNKHFLLTITLSYFKEKIFLPFFFSSKSLKCQSLQSLKLLSVFRVLRAWEVRRKDSRSTNFYYSIMATRLLGGDFGGGEMTLIKYWSRKKITVSGYGHCHIWCSSYADGLERFFYHFNRTRSLALKRSQLACCWYLSWQFLRRTTRDQKYKNFQLKHNERVNNEFQSTLIYFFSCTHKPLSLTLTRW